MRQQARQGRPIPSMYREGVALEPEQLERAVEAERARGGRLGNEVVAQVELKQEGQVFEPLDALFFSHASQGEWEGGAWYVLGREVRIGVWEKQLAKLPILRRAEGFRSRPGVQRKYAGVVRVRLESAVQTVRNSTILCNVRQLAHLLPSIIAEGLGEELVESNVR